MAETKLRKPIKVEIDGIAMEVTPDDAMYAKLKKSMDDKVELELADDRAKLADRIKGVVKDEIKAMIEEYKALEGDKLAAAKDPTLVLASWALGVWFDGSKQGWSDTEFVRGNLLELRERAKRSDAGQPKDS